MYSYTLDDAHKVWLDGHLIPQTPAKITYEYPDKTETIRLANHTNLTIPRMDEPIKISFEFKVTTDMYPWTWDPSEEPTLFSTREHWTDYLWTVKQDREPIMFDVQRKNFDLNVSMKVLLTDWHFVEDAEDHSDWTISVNLIEYFGQMNQEVDTTLEHHLILNRGYRGWASKRGR